jgi:N-ethylmaleimide reductase
MKKEKDQLLFNEPFRLGSLAFGNRIPEAPRTRPRPTDNLPKGLIADSCAWRASAGRIIPEGLGPSPNGVGYARIPELFSQGLVRSWKEITRSMLPGGQPFNY